MKNTIHIIRNNARSISYIAVAIVCFVSGVASHNALTATSERLAGALYDTQEYRKPLTELEIETDRVYTSSEFQATSKRRAQFIASVNLKNKHQEIAGGYIENALTLNATIDRDVDAVLPASEAIQVHTPKQSTKK